MTHSPPDEPETGPDHETISLLRLVAALMRALTNVVTAAASIVGPYDSGHGGGRGVIGGLGPPPLKGDDVATARNIVKHIFEVTCSFPSVGIQCLRIELTRSTICHT